MTCTECSAAIPRTHTHVGYYPLCAACRALPCVRCRRDLRASVHPDTRQGQQRWCAQCRRAAFDRGRVARLRDYRTKKARAA